ncbi:uncharacterized protein LOC114306729 [Camellia sinensis]|uniref:uncharacterized protein LOC114306729 n=1 Tax=Camellia sinensis TaxID=4442 RepID=UPI0010363717|nr:uncharacterized protein LOC114306729 [Camellia sinensis]
MATRGKFARVCVEMDLSRPLKPRFLLEGNCYTIEYESLHSFCFLCGQVDHRKEACRFKTNNAPPEGKNPATTSETNGYLQQEVDNAEAFGPWMLVTKRNRRPVHNKRAQDPHDPTYRNKFKSLEEGPDGQASHHRRKKNIPVGHDIAQQEPNIHIGSNQPNEPKGKGKGKGRAHHLPSTDSDNHNTIQRQSSWKLSEKGTSSHHRDQTAIATELIPSVVYTQPPNDLTMVDINLPQSTRVLSPLINTPALNPSVPSSHNREPPDPGDPIHGDGRQPDCRLPTNESGKAPQPDQLSEPIVRSRDRSNSPRHFRMVDRTNMNDSRAKLGGQETEAFPLVSNGLHEGRGRRPSEDPQHH